MKKIISIALTLALLLSTCLIAGIIPANAETQHWLEFEEKEMPSYVGAYGWQAWSIDPTTPYRCATWENWGYITPEFANIRKLVVSEDGTLTIENKWSATGITNNTADQSFEFAILDENKKIVYPENGDVVTVTKGTPVEVNFSTSVESGDVFYFVFMNATTTPLAYYTSSIITLNSTRLDNGGGYYCTDITTQGASGWYYMYAEGVTKTTLDPNGYSDNGGDIYTATYTVQEMSNLKDVPGSSRTDGWGCGGGFNDTGVTFAQGGNIYPRAGQTAIVRYTASEHGYFDIGYCGVELYNSWGANQGVDFAIIDSNGNVIYPEYGGPAQLRGGDEPGDKSTVPSRLYHYNMEAGDYLDFVFIPTATTPNTYNYIAYVNMSGSFSFNGDRVDSSGRLNLTHNEAQGTRGVTMLYSTDMVVEKTITDEWTDYVQLSKPFTAAPATIEAYVNIPTNVPDWKQGVIISDMGGADETNGFEASMDYLGHPRLVLAGGAVDVIFDTVDLRTGKWEHIAFTYDAATGEAKFYMNGELADTKTVATATLSASDRHGVIGNDMTYTKSSAFQGAMKKLAVFSDVRSADEITADMAGVSFSADGLIGYWMLNGGYSDKSSNANTGVLTTVGTAWYKADAPADAKDGEFTIVHIGDQQVATDFIYGLYPKMTEWIVANKDRLNIKSVINTGDLVNNEETQSQWNDAVNGTNKLIDAKIPYIFAIGNHEYPASGTKQRDPSKLNAEFPISTYFTQGEEDDTTQIIYSYPNTEKLTSVEALTNESIENAVYVQTINGKTYIYFAFEVQPRDIVVDWANIVMPKIEAEYPDATTIVGTHHYLTAQGKIDTTLGCFTEAHRTECNSPAEFYDNFVKKYKSISLVLNGHVASDIATRTDIGVNGNKIVSIMNDPSYEGDGGQGVMLLLRYKADGTVKAEYYSPLLDAYYKANSQFEFDSEKVETKLDLSEMKDMGWCRSDVVWFKSSSLQGGHYIAKNYLHTYLDNAVAKAYTASVDGRISLTVRLTDGGANQNRAEYMICKSDGTILKPWKSLEDIDLPNRTNKVYDVTVATDIKAGEKIYMIYRDKTAQACTVNTTQWGTLTPGDGSAAIAISSSDMTATKGENGWSCHYIAGASITEKAVTYSVTYSAAEGGTITAQTGGTWAADKLTIEAGGTAYFTTKPAPGYKFAGYFIDGKLYYTGRRLVYANVNSDMVVEARFEKIKQAGDANFDGAVDILDLVTMKKNPTAVNALMADLYDPNNENIIDDYDSAALRTKLLK